MIRLDLADIQGNIHRPYGRFGFPHTRHFFLNIADASAGRRFVQGVRPRITTAEPWEKAEARDGTSFVVKPPITLNIGFTFYGLHALGLPTRTLRLLPDEFIDGMGCRSEILGDVGGSSPDRWDRIWDYRPGGKAPTVHMWVSFSVGANPDGTPLPVLSEWTAWLEGLVAASAGGVTLLAGHGADGSGKWQDSAALMAPGPDGTMVPQPKEHFGFTDGISDPVFRGQFDNPAAEALAAIGGGKIAEGRYDQKTSWSALETGEFILGQVDEGQEFPVATEPAGFARNGTFMVYRKLRQDVEAFDREIERQADLWKRHFGVTSDLGSQGDDLRQDGRALALRHPALRGADLGRAPADDEGLGRLFRALAAQAARQQGAAAPRRLCLDADGLSLRRRSRRIEMSFRRAYPPRQSARHARPPAQRRRKEPRR